MVWLSKPNQKWLRVGSRDRLIGGYGHGVHLSWLSQGLVLDRSFAMTIGKHHLTTKHETVVLNCHQLAIKERLARIDDIGKLDWRGFDDSGIASR